MKLWVILPVDKITDDRAYFVGYLKGAFDEVLVSYAERTAAAVPAPPTRPDVILNLVSSRNRALLANIDAKGHALGVPVSPPSHGSWRTEDKRTYLEDFADVSPPTLIARDLDAVRGALHRFGGDIVVKDPMGDRGNGVERVRSEADLAIVETLLGNTICGTGELVVQPYLSGFANGDKRILVQRMPDNSFKIIAYILRQPPPGGWKSNIRNGGLARPTRLTQAETDFASAIAPRAGIDNVALDVAEHEGRLYYIEHNQGYGGIIDFDLHWGTRNVRYCAEFLLHIARHGRPDA